MDNAPERPDQPGIQPRGILQILQTGFELYQAHWKELMAIAAAVIVPLTFLQYLLSHAFAAKTEFVLRNGHLVGIHTAGFWRRAIGAVLFGLLALLVNQVLTGAITRAVASDSAGSSITFEDSYRFGLSRLGPILVVGLLVGIAVIVSVIPGILIALGVPVLGILVAIVAGFWVGLRLAFSMPVLVIENKRGSAALRRSWELVRGLWWQVFGVLIIAGLLSGIVSGILAAPFGSNWFLRSIGAMIGSIVTVPFTTSVLVITYLDVRARKEHLDLGTLRGELDAGGI